MMKRQKGGGGKKVEDRTRMRRWSGRNDGDTGWVEHRVAKTSGELSFKIHNCLFSDLHLPFKEGQKM